MTIAIDPPEYHLVLGPLASAGDLARMAALFEELSYPEENASACIQRAARHGHADCVAFLIPRARQGSQHSHAMRSAALHGSVECVQLLLPVSDPSADNSAALRAAAENGHFECAKLLLPFAALSDDPTPFHLSIKDGQAKAVAFMLDHKPSLATLIDPVLLGIEAEAKGHRELAALLLSLAEAFAIGDSAPAPLAPPRPSPRI